MRSLATIVLLLLPLWSALAQANKLDKKITVHLTNVTVEEALSIISKVSAIEFTYSDDVVPVNERVSIAADEQKLSAVLSFLLINFQIEYKYTRDRIIFRKAPAPLSQTVRGTIVDQHTHLPLPGANIIVVDSSPLLGAISDSEGRFKIPKVPVGRSTLQISTIGYQSRILSNMLLGTGKELILEIKLMESATTINEVVVTANQNDQSNTSEPTVVSGYSFSVEETKRYAGSLGDPARMASGFPGVVNGSDESNALIVRGNSPRGVLWRIDGIEVPNPNHFATEGSSNGVVSILSSNIIDNSDFLTGAFPAVYGNALSAVFDMKLRKGNNEKREHSFQVGLLGLEASTEGPFNANSRSSYLINYRYSTLNILDKIGVDLNDAGEYKNYQDLSFKMDFPVKNNGRFSIFGIGGLSKSTQENGNAFANDYSNMGVTGITYQKIMNDNTSIVSALSWSGTSISNYNEILGLGSGILKVEENYNKSYIRASMLADRKLSEKIYLKGGFIYNRLYYNFYLRNRDPNNQAYQEIINFQEQNNTGITQAFVTAQQNFTPKLLGIYGVHFIHFGLTKDYAVEPRAGIRWQVTNTKSLSAGYGKHSRIENLQYYLARDHQTGGDEVQINKNLGFTRADHYVIAYEQSFTQGHKFKVETYYQQLYNAPVQADPSSMYSALNEDSGFITDTLLNNGKGRNYGIELSLWKSFSKNFYYQLNGSLYQSKFTVSDLPERNTTYNGNYNFHLLVGKEFKVGNNRDGFGINIKITTAGGRRYVPIDVEKSIAEDRQVYDWENAFDPQLPDYFRTDIQLVYRKNKPRYATEWRVNIQNVTNHVNPAYYYYNAALQKISMKNQVGILPVVSYRIEF